MNGQKHYTSSVCVAKQHTGIAHLHIYSLLVAECVFWYIKYIIAIANKNKINIVRVSYVAISLAVGKIKSVWWMINCF